MKISVVTPVYKAENCLEELYNRLGAELLKISKDYEIIFVNDASPDDSWQIIKRICSKDKKARGIKFSRNFGQHFAITAGLDYTSGDYVVVMDCDLQDRPEDIPKLYKHLIKNNLDVVFGQRIARKDNFIKKLGSKVFYSFYNYFTETKFDNSVANFSISRAIVIENFRRLRERSRSFPLFIKWMGFDAGLVEISHSKRFDGRSSYDFGKLVNLAIDSVVSQSNKPLRLAIKVGFILSLLSLILALYLIARYLFYGVSVQGWTSLIVSIFFLSGLMMANMGILGIYIGKIFDETKSRPLYLIQETIGIKDKKDLQ